MDSYIHHPDEEILYLQENEGEWVDNFFWSQPQAFYWEAIRQI